MEGKHNDPSLECSVTMICNYLAGVALLLPLLAGAQTTSWKLIWSANSEPNMWYYEVYRDTVPDPVTRLATVIHPETVFVDSSIQKGVRYYYRLRAVDSSFSKSGF